MINIAPRASIVRALCNQNLTIRTALCEWIDNALDAGARTVSVTFGTGKQSFVSVEDDGSGKSDLSSFVRLGDHDRHRSTKSGTYGVGAKDAALYFGGEQSRFAITSTNGGVERALTVDWALLDDKWEIDDPVERVAPLPQTPGTKIVVAPVIRRIPDGADWQRLLDDLGYVYSPAIKRGIQIKVQSKRRGSEPQVLTPWKLPALQPGHVDTRIEVGGRTARVYAGVVREGERNPRPGLTYTHGFRVIAPACAAGCGQHSISRIAGFVDIDDSWSRNKNKDGIQNADALYDAVESALKALLVRADQQGSELRSAAFAKAVEGLINDAINDAKARRGRGDETGTKAPRDTGRRHRDAAKKQRGTTMPMRQAGSIRIEFGSLGDADRIGRIHGNGIVELNTDARAVEVARKSENVLTIASLACSLIASDRAIRGDGANVRLNFRTDEENEDAVEVFSKVLGRLVSAASEYDGRSLIAEVA